MNKNLVTVSKRGKSRERRIRFYSTPLIPDDFQYNMIKLQSSSESCVIVGTMNFALKIHSALRQKYITVVMATVILKTDKPIELFV